jgi:uncharacterized membrane protein
MAMQSAAARVELNSIVPQIAERVYSVDLLRGVIMVIMALDHVRDYVSGLQFPPEFLARTWPALFYTRWITHFCAPWFCFLAGTGAYLALSRGRSPSQIRGLLWKRGIWLILLEWTVVSFGWTFLPLPLPVLLVLTMLGCCMMFLALLVNLPVKWIGAIGVAMILLHNLADGIRPEQFGAFGWFWKILHVQAFIGSVPPRFAFGGRVPVGFFVLYPLVPWLGVMAAGYAFGALMRKPIAARRRILLWLGTACIAVFLLLRATNWYGNPHSPNGLGFGDFHSQKTAAMTVVAFLNTAKYPPSLQFLLMTLGPGFLALAWFDRFHPTQPSVGAGVGRFFLVYGRVPMFYYVLHIYLAHLLAVVLAFATHQSARWLLKGGFFLSGPPPGYGHALPVVYAVWIAVVLLLYFPCRWFMGVKQRRRDWWLAYM